MLLTKRTITASSNYRKVVPIIGYQRQLESLYARRSAVETLIQSLEDYQRFRAQRLEQRVGKTA